MINDDEIYARVRVCVCECERVRVRALIRPSACEDNKKDPLQSTVGG